MLVGATLMVAGGAIMKVLLERPVMPVPGLIAQI
jgi:ABC-type cobalamin transport system permease subunit